MKKYNVKLKKKEEKEIKKILRFGKHLASVRNRAQVLLLSHRGMKDEEISEIVSITTQSIHKIRSKYCNLGLKVAIYGLLRSGRPAKFDIKDEANLTALACSEAPEGSSRWTLGLLRSGMGNTMSVSTVHLLLKKTNANRGRKKCGVSEE